MLRLFVITLFILSPVGCSSILTPRAAPTKEKQLLDKAQEDISQPPAKPGSE